MSKLMTLRETAERLSMSYQATARLVREGFLPVVKLGRVKRVNPIALEHFISDGGKGLAGGWRKEPRDGDHAAN
jgi:excisionase family DNA binding protein